MCVIIVCKRGVALPSVDELKAAYLRNHDGCGFVSESSHYKSLHFSTFLRKLMKRDINENVIIHFRLATHGSVSVKNCHPFYKGGYWFAHNGILPICSEHDKTDSQICFERFIYPTIKKNGWGSLQHQDTMGDWTAKGSKFAMMHNGEILTSGQFIEHEGRLYSNLVHLDWMSTRKRIVNF